VNCFLESTISCEDQNSVTEVSASVNTVVEWTAQARRFISLDVEVVSDIVMKQTAGNWRRIRRQIPPDHVIAALDVHRGWNQWIITGKPIRSERQRAVGKHR